MKKNLFLLLVFLFVFIVQAEEKVEIKDVKPFWYVCMEFQGSYMQISQKIPVLFKEIRKQKISSKIKGRIFCIYFESSSPGGEPKWALAFQILKGTPVQSPLKISEYKYKKIARIIHVGPYESVGNSYNKIFPYIEEKSFERSGPVLNVWLDDNPDKIKPEEYRTEIIVPIKKLEK